jgi:heat shock protein HtpX
MNTNSLKTVFFMVLLMVIFVGLGGMLAGRVGMIIAFIIAMGLNFFTYWFSDKMVLKMYKAKPVTENEAPGLYGIVRRLTSKAELPMPKVYIINNSAPNAFATGRNPNHAAVAVTSGLMDLLNNDELEGVLAHELAHIHGRDILIGTVAATVAGAIMMLADWAQWALIFGGGDDNDNPLGIVGVILAMIIAPIAAMLVQMAISRSREYLADQKGASLCGNPHALASALSKISAGVQRTPMKANAATTHMLIMNPLRGKKNWANLFSTHPPVEERIKRLENMAYAR